MQRQDPAIFITIVLAAAVLVAAAVFISGCTAQVEQGASSSTREAWRSIPFQDIRTGETLTIGGFSGRPVILYAFTVSCPVCTRQQKEITALKTALGDNVEVIGLDIDPGEDAETLKAHIAQNEFKGYYALSPIEMTQSLLDEFGPVVITPASAPVIAICPDGTARILDTGIKPSNILRAAVTSEC